MNQSNEKPLGLIAGRLRFICTHGSYIVYNSVLCMRSVAGLGAFTILVFPLAGPAAAVAGPVGVVAVTDVVGFAGVVVILDAEALALFSSSLGFLAVVTTSGVASVETGESSDGIDSEPIRRSLALQSGLSIVIEFLRFDDESLSPCAKILRNALV